MKQAWNDAAKNVARDCLRQAPSGSTGRQSRMQQGLARELRSWSDRTSATGTEERRVLLALLPQVWRTIGDEVVFVRPIVYPGEVFVGIRALKIYLSKNSDAIRNRLGPNTDRNLSPDFGLLKATIWLATARPHHLGASQSTAGPIYRNIVSRHFDEPQVEKTSTIERAEPIGTSKSRDGGGDLFPYMGLQEKSGTVEFLGRNIDEGFRVAKYSKPGYIATSLSVALHLLDYRLALAPDMMRMILQEGEPLKGLLSGGAYPKLLLPVEGDAANQTGLRGRGRKIQKRLQIAEMAIALGAIDEASHNDCRHYFLQVMRHLMDDKEPGKFYGDPSRVYRNLF